MKSNRNIGGSLLNSSCPEILEPILFRSGALQVVPDYDADTHHLQFNGKTIASHPNGYSCHSLAKRIVVRFQDRIWSQAKYIVSCGGDVDFDAVNALIA